MFLLPVPKSQKSQNHISWADKHAQRQKIRGTNWPLLPLNERTSWLDGHHQPSHERKLQAFRALDGLWLYLQHHSGEKQRWSSLESWHFYWSKFFKKVGSFWSCYLQLINKGAIRADIEVIFWHHGKASRCHHFWWRSCFFDGSVDNASKKWVWWASSSWLLSHPQKCQEESCQKRQLEVL